MKLGLALGFLGLALSLTAEALPTPGNVLQRFQVSTADGVSLPPSDGRPAVILYESRSSRPQNYPFKTRLKELAAADPSYRERIAIVAIVNLEAYDFWPIRGLAENAIRNEGKRVGLSLYCDWDGAVARVLGAHAEQALVVVLSPAGQVLFAAEGPLTEAQQTRALELLRAQTPR